VGFPRADPRDPKDWQAVREVDQNPVQSTEPLPRSLWGGMLVRFSGVFLAAAFYGFLFFVPSPLLTRYFLGHPVAVAETVLFCLAIGQLGSRYLQMVRNRAASARLADRDLLPAPLYALAGLEGSGEMESQMDRGTPIETRIGKWLEHLAALSGSLAGCGLVVRLRELLQRQGRRGHVDQLNDDLRDLADRQADADHDALQLVRIIIWSIPMLGFLGTVVGITQTLGGLDFTNGAAAVEQLKSGLYVAFDTTAIGLILSVIAIFLQFPVEKHDQQFREAIDSRMVRLLPSVLAAEPKIVDDDPLHALRQMTVEIARTVQTSIQLQAEVWRQTIDEAHGHWQQASSESAEHLQQAIREALGSHLTTSLREHAQSLRQAQREGVDQIDRRWQQWQTALSDNARVLLAHQKTLLSQGELLAQSHARARELQLLQETLDRNLLALDQSLQGVERSTQVATGAASMGDAMLTLARAVDILATRFPPQRDGESSGLHSGPSDRSAATSRRNAA